MATRHCSLPATKATPRSSRRCSPRTPTNQVDNNGCTPLYFASQQGHPEVVTKLLAANADVNQPADGATPLIIASAKGRADIVAKRRRARSERRREPRARTRRLDRRLPPRPPRLRPAPLLLRRQPHLPHRRAVRHGGAAATHAATTTSSPSSSAPASGRRRSTTSSSSRHERALALLRAGADIHAAAEPGGPTPRLARAGPRGGGRRAAGTAAFLVLEAAKPWSQPRQLARPRPRARGRALAVGLPPFAAAPLRGRGAGDVRRVDDRRARPRRHARLPAAGGAVRILRPRPVSTPRPAGLAPHSPSSDHVRSELQKLVGLHSPACQSRAPGLVAAR